MLEKTNVELEECPQKLQEAVKEYLSTYGASKILSITVTDSTPYIDKSITETSYRVYLEYGNLLTVFRFSLRSKDKWSDREVNKTSMIAGDMIEFINKSWWFSEYRKDGNT